MRHPVNLPALLVRTVMPAVVAGAGLTVCPYGFATGIEFVDTPRSTQAGAPQPIGPAFRLSDSESPAAKKRREQSEDVRSACRKEAALTAKTELGVRVLLEECEREHKKRMGE